MRTREGALISKITVVTLLFATLLTPTPWATTTAEYVGPGSMGAVTAMGISPINGNFVLAGTDVGGVYLSADGGANWKSVNLNLPVQGVFSIAYSHDNEVPAEETLRIILGTESGVYYSNVISIPMTGCTSTAGCSAITDWTEATGIVRAPLTYATNSAVKELHADSIHVSPIGVVVVDPTDPDVAWAGVARTGGLDLAADKDGGGEQVQRFDTWKVYRSNDRGETWEPELRFSAPATSAPYFDPDTSTSLAASDADDDGNVFGILVLEEDPEQVLVSSDRGLYRRTYDQVEAAYYWEEIGTQDYRTTYDGGMSWTAGTSACNDWTSPTSYTEWCLPIVDSAYIQYIYTSSGRVSPYPDTADPTIVHAETHPNLRAIGTSQVKTSAEATAFTRIYVAVWDIGYYDDPSTTCSGDTDSDTNMTHFRGGIYYSDDLGDTWRWLFTDDGAPDGTLLFSSTTLSNIQTEYRCDETSGLRALSTGFLEMGAFSAIPSYTVGSGGGQGEIVLMAGSYGSRPGLFSYRVAPTPEWRFHSNKVAGTWTNYEGAAPYNLSAQTTVPNHGPGLGDVIAQWGSSSTIHPPVYLSAGPRGALKATFATAPGPTTDYYFNHLGSNRVGSPSSLPATWMSTGLDDACVFDAEEVGEDLFIGVSDAGLLRGDLSISLYDDVGAFEWQVNGCSTSSPPSSSCVEDYDEQETRAIDVDCDTLSTCIVYAGNYTDDGNNSTGSVLMSTDNGVNWEVIGGTGWDSSGGLNGLGELAAGDVTVLVRALAHVPNATSYAGGVELLAGGKWGLWAYVGGTWENLCSSYIEDDATAASAAIDTVSDIEIYEYDDGDDGGALAFVTVSSNDYDSLLAVDLDDAALTCVSMNSATSSTLAFETSTTLAVGSKEESCEDADQGSPTLFVGAVAIGAGASYDRIFEAEIDPSNLPDLPWNEVASLQDYASALPSLMPSLDPDLWDQSLKKLAFSAIAVNPQCKSDIWASVGAGPYFDYVNTAYLFEWNPSTGVFDAWERQDLGLPNGNVKFMDFNDSDQLYVGSCSSLYQVTF